MIELAKQNYRNPACMGEEEFLEDYAGRPKFIMRLLRRYIGTKEINARLILNHIQTMYNVFDEFAFDILYENIEPELRTYLKTIIILGGFNNSQAFVFKNISVDINLFNKIRGEFDGCAFETVN